MDERLASSALPGAAQKEGGRQAQREGVMSVVPGGGRPAPRLVREPSKHNRGGIP